MHGCSIRGRNISLAERNSAPELDDRRVVVGGGGVNRISDRRIFVDFFKVNRADLGTLKTEWIVDLL